jgi:hypothetical protein
MSCWSTSASVTEWLRPRTRLSATVILISTHAQSEYAEEIAASPAVGFIPKTQLSASAVLRLAAGPID